MSDRDAASRVRPDVALAEGTRFQGLLVLTRSARIDGHLRGEVCADDAVEIGAKGIVEADLDASEISIDGKVKGDVVARGAIVLGRESRVLGDVVAAKLRMAEGARIDGRVRCGTPPPAPTGEPPDSHAANPTESGDPGPPAS